MTRLDDAIRSLREDVGGASPDAGKTLTQILGATRARGSAMRARLLSLLAATFVLVGASAWAALSTRERVSQTGRGPEVSVSAPPTTSAAPTTHTLPIPVLAPLATTVPSSALPSDRAEPLARVPSARPPPLTATEPRRSEELAAYEKAHRAHFDEHNASSALALWDDYLKKFPATRWEPEARYNRALCLIRLKRIQEARQALAPFARGDYGGYRRREASALLAALADAGE